MNGRFISFFTKVLLSVALLLMILFSGFSQTARNYAISLQTDNDSYLMIRQDQYYTNGLILTFDKPLRHSESQVDLLSVQLGHQLFNGSLIYVQNDLHWDRPSTGRFFINTQFQRTYKSDWLWNVKAEVGTVGEAGKGKQIQHFIHKMFKMYEVESWESNLKSSIGLDLEASVLKSFWRSEGAHFEVSGKLVGRGGMNFSHISSQVIFRAGRLAPYSQSNFVGNGGFFSDDKESYFFYVPGYMYQFYNATIQGGLFARRREERYDISKNVFSHQVGYAYSRRRFAIEAAVLFNTREGKEMYSNHQFARVKVGFRF